MQPQTDEHASSGSSMRYKILLLCGILAGTLGQIFMKLGVESLGGISFSGSPFGEMVRIFSSPYVLVGLACTGASMGLWLTVISHLELSFAYPFVALSHVLITGYGWAVLSENVGALRLAGVASIMVGVVVISRTEHRRSED